MEIFLTFEEDPRKKKKEIPIIVRGGDMSDEYIANSIAAARTAIEGDFNIKKLERVIFVKDRIINFVMKQPKKRKK